MEKSTGMNVAHTHSDTQRPTNSTLVDMWWIWRCLSIGINLLVVFSGLIWVCSVSEHNPFCYLIRRLMCVVGTRIYDVISGCGVDYFSVYAVTS